MNNNWDFKLYVWIILMNFYTPRQSKVDRIAIIMTLFVAMT